MYGSACWSAQQRDMDPPEWGSAKAFLGYASKQLLAALLTQNFFCYVSRIPFSSPCQMSLERTNENRSYTADNCCFIMRWFQRYHSVPREMQWTSTKCQQVLDFRRDPSDDGNWMKEVDQAREWMQGQDSTDLQVLQGQQSCCGLEPMLVRLYKKRHGAGTSIRNNALQSGRSSRKNRFRCLMSRCNNSWMCTNLKKDSVLILAFLSDWTRTALEARPPTGHFHQSEWMMTAGTP